MKTTVVNLVQQEYDVYIGRPRKSRNWGYGNPFVIGRDGNREEVIRKFESWLSTGESFGNKDAAPERRRWILENAHALKGKRLGCFCYPKACHGHVLVELAEGRLKITRPEDI